MSYDGIAWAWRQRTANTHQRCVLLALGETHGHHDGLCFPGLDTLAKMVGASRRRVLAELNKLEAAEVIRIERGGGRRPNYYTLVGLREVDEVPPGEPQDEVPPEEPQRDQGDEGSGSLPCGSGSLSPCSSSTGVTGIRTPGSTPEEERTPAPGGGRPSAAVDQKIQARDFTPRPELEAELRATRPELDFAAFLRKFYSWDWQRPRTLADWEQKLRARWSDELPPGSRAGRDSNRRVSSDESQHPALVAERLAREAQRRREQEPVPALNGSGGTICPRCDGEGCRACCETGRISR